MTASTGYLRALGCRLRAARNQQGLSLGRVEALSRGRWKASVVGSWERGERSIPTERLIGLAAFYDIPAGVLLTGGHDVDEAVIAAAVAAAVAIDRARACALILEEAS